jgi:guanylate kinase
MIVIITGPTASGKTTLERRLIDQERMLPLLSYTTRPKRKGEVDKESFIFLKSKQEFESRIVDGHIIEYAEYGDHYYGTSTSAIDRASDHYHKYGRYSVGVFEPQGALRMMDYCNQMKVPYCTVYMDVSPEVAQRRMIERFDHQIETMNASFTDGNELIEYLDYYAMRMAISAECEPEWGAGFPCDVYVPESMNDGQLGQTVISIMNFEPPDIRPEIGIPPVRVYIPGKPLISAYRAMLAQHLSMLKLQQRISSLIASPHLQALNKQQHTEIKQELSALLEQATIMAKQFEISSPEHPAFNIHEKLKEPLRQEFVLRR